MFLNKFLPASFMKAETFNSARDILFPMTKNTGKLLPSQLNTGATFLYKYPAKNFPGFFLGKQLSQTADEHGWTRMSPRQTGICVCLRSSAVPHMQIRNSEKTHYPACAGCKKPLRLIFALLANFHGVMRFFRVPKYPAKSFPGFFSGKTAFTNRGWTRMNADESGRQAVCVHLRFTMRKLFLICRYLKTYGQVLNTWWKFCRYSQKLIPVLFPSFFNQLIFKSKKQREQKRDR